MSTSPSPPPDGGGGGGEELTQGLSSLDIFEGGEGGGEGQHQVREEGGGGVYVYWKAMKFKCQD